MTIIALLELRLPTRWLLVAGMMLVTFLFGTDLFSSQNTSPIVRWVLSWFLPRGTDIQVLGGGEGFLRKTAHFLEYALLAYLWWRALRGDSREWKWRWVILAWTVTTLWAMVDELQQGLFSRQRTGNPWDVVIDSSGALTAMILVCLFTRKDVNHQKESQSNQYPP
ncbi:MAG TPA: VanZ family protein [Gemmatales bacterium]|nr:VanZ family protein [Gemmatales bacterium]